LLPGNRPDLSRVVSFHSCNTGAHPAVVNMRRARLRSACGSNLARRSPMSSRRLGRAEIFALPAASPLLGPIWQRLLPIRVFRAPYFAFGTIVLLPVSNEISYSRKTNPKEFSDALAVFAVYHLALIAFAKPKGHQLRGLAKHRRE
jgi:hypothetical protein